MKKYIYILFALFTFAFIFSLFNISPNSASAYYDSGCTSFGQYSITTGQPCYGYGSQVGYQTNSYIPGCTSLGLYSTITGQFCGGAQNNYQTNSYDPGCVSGAQYSITTGQFCYGSGVNSVNSPNIFSNQQFQIGARGSDVIVLQQMLANAGFYMGRIDGVYGPMTDNAFIAYQSQYSNNYNPYPVNPYPINPYPINPYPINPYPTNQYPVYNQPPIISGVSGPQSLSVNQTGTWTVNAYNNSNIYSNSSGNLTYSVNWGDQLVYGYPNSNSSPSYLTTQQSATFTHSYMQSGTYTAVFTVTNSTGQTAQTTLSVVVSGSTNYYGVPTISSVTPAYGVVGTQVTIYGTGFGSNNCTFYAPCTNIYSSPNTIKFGSGSIQNVYSQNGTSLTFTIPSTLNNCSYTNQYCTQVYLPVNPTTYPISVINANGSTSNTIDFRVIGYMY